MSAITVSEAQVLDKLGAAWNAFLLLKPEHPDDLPDFRHHIHAAQRIVLSRVAFTPSNKQALRETLP